MSSNPYGPKSAELEVLLLDVLEHFELCKAISKAVHKRRASEDKGGLVILSMIDGPNPLPENRESRAFAIHLNNALLRRGKWLNEAFGYSDAVSTALEYYALGSIFVELKVHPGYALATAALDDYLAISKRTHEGDPTREVALDLLGTLKDEVAVDAAIRTISGDAPKLE